MRQAHWPAIGAALIALAATPVAAMADEAPAVSQLALMSGLQGTSTFNISLDPAATDPKAQVASIPSDGAITPPPLVPGGSGFYIETGASWQHVDLPSVNLGFVTTTPGTATPPFGYLRPTATTNLVATGVGGDIAIGYHLPAGWVSPSLGAAPRVELDFSIVDASQAQTTGFAPTVPNGGAITGMMLNGTVVNNAPICTITGVALSCPTTSSVSSHYQDWHLGLKGATDFQFGMVTVSPSLSFIGGEGQNDIKTTQSLAQVIGGVTGITQNYVARVKLQSDDVGGKIGLNLKFPIANGLSAALGGSLAVVDRETTLHGNDLFVSNVPGLIPIAPQPSPLLTSTSSSKNRAAVLSNVEGSLNFTVTPAVSLRIFGGMNYDDSVPGVKAPTYVGSEPFPSTPAGSAARVKFVSEVNFYGGAGVSIHF